MFGGLLLIRALHFVVGSMPVSLPFTTEEYTSRLARVRAAILTRKIDLLVVTEPDDIEWLSGFQANRAAFCVLLVPCIEPPCFMLCEVDRATLFETSFYRDCTTYQAGAPVMRELVSLLIERGVYGEFVGLQFSTRVRAITDSQRIMLVKAFTSARWADTSWTIAWLRAVKTAAEVRKLETAVEWTTTALEAASHACIRGATENNILSLMTPRLLAQIVTATETTMAGRWPAFQPRVVIGAASSSGAATSTARIVTGEFNETPGQLVLLECAASCDGYHAPATRTVFVGAVLPVAIRKLENLVNDALNAQLAAMIPGKLAGDVFAAAQDVFVTSTLPASSLGCMGYSVGLSSAPDAGDCPLELTSFCEQPLVLGMVLNLTPWLQTPWGAISLSALAVVGQRKGRVLGRPAASISRPDIGEAALRR